jgi:hypothetical protein
MKSLIDRRGEGTPIENSLPPGKNCPALPWLQRYLPVKGVNLIGLFPRNFYFPKYSVTIHPPSDRAD